MFKVLTPEEREQEDYQLFHLEDGDFYISRQNIADFNSETENLSDVYKVIREQRNGVLVVPIKNKTKLERITNQWAKHERDISPYRRGYRKVESNSEEEK